MNSRQTVRACFTVTAPGDEQFLWSLEADAVYIRKVAPLGDPVEITIRGYELSLRKHDAACVEVKQK